MNFLQLRKSQGLRTRFLPMFYMSFERVSGAFDETNFRIVEILVKEVCGLYNHCHSVTLITAFYTSVFFSWKCYAHNHQNANTSSLIKIRCVEVIERWMIFRTPNPMNIMIMINCDQSWWWSILIRLKLFKIIQKNNVDPKWLWNSKLNLNQAIYRNRSHRE